MLHLEAGRYDVAMYHWHYYSTRRLCVHHGRRVAKKSQESAMGLHNQIRIQNGAGTKQHWRPNQKERCIALQEVRYFYVSSKFIQNTRNI